MPTLLADQVAIVTGGASGIGLATVEAFVEHGAKVVIADLSDDTGEAAAARLGASVRYVHTDVTVDSDVEAVVAAAVQSFGKLDVMFNNAGVTGDAKSLLDVTTTEFEQVIKVDVLGVILGHKYAGRQFRAQGTGGSIISTASTAAIQGGWGDPLYTIAKHAVPGVVRAAAVDFSQYGIRTNTIAPGIIATPLVASSFGVSVEHSDEFLNFLGARLAPTQPLGRLGRGQDVAGAAVYLASDLSQWVTGTVLVVDGGATSMATTAVFQMAAEAGKEWVATER